MTTEHPYAHLLRAIAAGQAVERRNLIDAKWVAISDTEALRAIGAGMLDPEGFRVKPATIRIGDAEVQSPLRKAPALHTDYYWPRLLGGPTYGRETWRNDPLDHQNLQRGLCWATAGGAEDAANALLGLLATPGAQA